MKTNLFIETFEGLGFKVIQGGVITYLQVQLIPYKKLI